MNHVILMAVGADPGHRDWMAAFGYREQPVWVDSSRPLTVSDPPKAVLSPVVTRW